MIRSTTKYGLMAATLLVGFLPAAHATTLASLHDWCINIDGADVFNNHCNTAQTTITVPAGVSGTGFDYTLDSQTEGTPATPYAGVGVNDLNTLGSITITLSPGANQFVLAYMDYDLNFNNLSSGSFSDYGSVHGTQTVANATAVNYALNDYNTCDGCTYGADIIDQFFNNTLNNSNNVGTYTVEGPCCDVSWALGLNLDVAAGTVKHVTFTVANTAPGSGFYLQQTSGTDNSQNIFLSAIVTVEETETVTPEPATMFMLGGGLLGAFLLRKRTVKA